MPIEENALKYWIDNFYGYGSWGARFWFISYEESGGDLPEEVAEKVNYFYQGPAQNIDATLCDIRELYQRVSIRWDKPSRSDPGGEVRIFSNRHEYRFGDNAVQNSIWKNLIAFTHGYKNEPLPDLLAYQKRVFAMPSASTEALIPLYPLPSPHNHAWYYSWLDLPQLGFLKSRILYQEHVFEHRIRKILSNIKTYKPEVVLMYGMNNVNALKKSVQEFFPNVKFNMIKATKLQTPQHHCADVDSTTLLITTQIPALRHNRIETGFDWEEFGRKVKSKTF